MISLCIKENKREILEYIASEIKKSSISQIFFSIHSFKIYQNLIVHYKGSNINKFYNFISRIISKSILKFYEPIILKNKLAYDYFYFNSADKKIILDEYNLLVKNKNNRLFQVIKQVNLYIKNNKSIVLNGFVNFRLANYLDYLDKLLQEAINQYVVDKEYFEFVDLLKGYVDSKIPDNITVNLVYVNSDAILLSEDGDIIPIDKFNSMYLSDISFSNNDYVLNTLIGILPSKICLHLISEEDAFIKTIRLIFTNKVSNCNGCALCSAYQTLKLK